MSEYKMNQYDLQRYFKSLCNSFYIAYENVTRLEKEYYALINDYNEEDLEMVNNLLEISVADSTQNKYITYKYSHEELEKEKERLEAEKQEFERKTEELNKILSYWSDSMLKDFENIKRVLYTIKHNSFSIIPTTKAEIYALIYFYGYCDHAVYKYPIVNVKEYSKKVYKEKVYETGSEVYAEFLDTYEHGLKNGFSYMPNLYKKYF